MPSPRLASRYFCSCPTASRENNAVRSVSKQLEGMASYQIVHETFFVLIGADAEDIRGITRLLPHVMHASAVSSNHLKEADLSQFQVCVLLVVLQDLQTFTQSEASQARSVLSDLNSNESTDYSIVLFVGKDPSFSEDYSEFLQSENYMALLDEADGVLFSCPSTPINACQLLSTVKVAEAWRDRTMKVTASMKEAMEEKIQRHLSMATRKMVWNAPLTVFPHIPPEDKTLADNPNGVGAYTYVKKVGQGGFGSVYLAKKENSSTYVAVKEITKSKGWSFSDLAQIEREIVILKGVLNHPNVLKIIECLHVKTRLCIVMEHLGSYSVEAYIRLRQQDHRRCTSMLPFAEVQRMLGHIIRAIMHCHSRCISHRDLKFSNLMIAPDGTITLIDFGLAVQAAPAQMLQGRCGTVPYIAPEVLRATKGKEYGGLAMDVWSFGIMTTELTCGCGTNLMIFFKGRNPKNFAHDEIAERSEQLAKFEVQKEILELVGEDVADSLADFQKMMSGIFQVSTKKRSTITDIAQLGFLAIHVGPIELPPQSTPGKAKDEKQQFSPRLSTENFNSKVLVRGYARPILADAEELPLLEAIGGPKIVSQAADTALDWLLPRHEFANFFLQCPLKMGRIRAGLASFLEQYLADPQGHDKSRLVAHHKHLDISDSLFNVFTDRLIQSFRMQGLRGSIVLETTRVIERLRPSITGGYRARLLAGEGVDFSSFFLTVKTTKEAFTTNLKEAIESDERLRSMRPHGYAFMQDFVRELWDGRLPEAAQAAFTSAAMRATLDQGMGGEVFFFCENMKQILAAHGAEPVQLQQMVCQLRHSGDVMVASYLGSKHMKSITEGGNASWFHTTLLQLCNADPMLRYYAEMPNFSKRCIPAIMKLSVESSRLRATHSRLFITDVRYNSLLVHVDKLLRTMLPWPLYPPSVCSDSMRSLEAFREDVVSGSTGSSCATRLVSPPGPPPPQAAQSPHGGLARRRNFVPQDTMPSLVPRSMDAFRESLRSDPRISQFFKSMCDAKFERLMSCISAALKSSAPPPAHAFAEFESLGITTYHFDCFQERYVASLDSACEEQVVARLENLRDVIVYKPRKKCPITGKAATGAWQGCPMGRSSSQGTDQQSDKNKMKEGAAFAMPIVIDCDSFMNSDDETEN